MFNVVKYDLLTEEDPTDVFRKLLFDDLEHFDNIQTEEDYIKFYLEVLSYYFEFHPMTKQNHIQEQYLDRLINTYKYEDNEFGRDRVSELEDKKQRLKNKRKALAKMNKIIKECLADHEKGME